MRHLQPAVSAIYPVIFLLVLLVMPQFAGADEVELEIDDGSEEAPRAVAPVPLMPPSVDLETLPEVSTETDQAPGLSEAPPAESTDVEEALVGPPTPTPIAEAPPPPPAQVFRILGAEVPPGSVRRLAWFADEAADGLPEATPVLVAHGSRTGPILCLTAAVHGDELNGIEIVREVLYDLDATRLAGTIIGVPIVNVHGFRHGTRYLPDRRDLNRFFPGNPRGSFASRVAYSFFNNIVLYCDYLVDLHTGSFQRTNLPQLRANLNDPGVQHLTHGFGATVVLHDEGPAGSLRRAATDAGIPTVVVETGEPMRFEPDQVAHGVRALRSVLNHLDMMPRFSLWREPQPTYYASSWVRAEGHGIFSSQVSLGQTVTEGAVLGTITDPITSARRTVHSPYSGRILGMALNQTVRPGYAIYHIGIRKTEEELIHSDDGIQLSHEETHDPVAGAVDEVPGEDSAE